MSLVAKIIHWKALEKADALVVATEWPQYKEVDATSLATVITDLVLIDANRFVQHLSQVKGVTYIAVGLFDEKVKLDEVCIE